MVNWTISLKDNHYFSLVLTASETAFGVLAFPTALRTVGLESIPEYALTTLAIAI